MARCYTRVLMLAGMLPYARDMGQKIGVMSDIDALPANGATTTLLAYDVGHSPADSLQSSCACVVIPTKAGGRLTRFVRAIPTSLPGAAERYYSVEARAIIRASVQRIRPPMIVIQSPTLAAWIPMLRELVPDAVIVARADNVVADIARQELAAAPFRLNHFTPLRTPSGSVWSGFLYAHPIASGPLLSLIEFCFALSMADVTPYVCRLQSLLENISTLKSQKEVRISSFQSALLT